MSDYTGVTYVPGSVFYVREGSASWEWLRNHRGPLRPGTVIPFGQANDLRLPDQLAMVNTAYCAYCGSEYGDLSIKRCASCGAPRRSR